MTVTAPDARALDGPKGPVPRALPGRLSTADKVFRYVTKASGGFTFLVLFLIGLFLFIQALPALRKEGLDFFTNTGFVTTGHHIKFGVASALFGSVVIAIIAVIVAVPASISSALFINEYAPRKALGFVPLKGLLTSLVDLMAAVPSVIYGLWGFFFLQPKLTGIAKFLSQHLSSIPLFVIPKGTVVFTGSYFIAGVLVGIMIMPIITSITREIFSLTPVGEREGAMALGATRAQCRPRRGASLRLRGDDWCHHARTRAGLGRSRGGDHHLERDVRDLQPSPAVGR